MSHTSLPTTLPVDQILPELKQALAQYANTILVAAPGAGKTTRVPLALLQQEWLGDQKILMLEPRRIATRNAARFMAQQLGEKTGQQVGYRMRMESVVSSDTRIEVITEGLLTRMLQDDPELTGVGLIIFDEFHERNLHSDLGLALAHNCQQLFRDDLKLLVMSATLDEQSLTQQLAAPLVRSEGRSFAVTTHYRPASEPLTSSRYRLAEHCARVINEALQQDGDMLVFLPGVAEIEAVRNKLQDVDAVIAPLHGQLKDSEQKLALQPLPLPEHQGKRKIILATNIAESSVTIDGVRIVIDSGLERIQQFDVRSGIERLNTENISQASATQRQGRAGRQAEGHCYRLWAESQHHTRAAHISADIAHTDLSGLLLELLQWGAEPDDLLWLSPPNRAALDRARQLLLQLNILQPDLKTLTAHGQQVCAAGLEPRWAHSLIIAGQQGCGQAAARLVALLQLLPHKVRHTDDLIQLWQQQHSNEQKQVSQLAGQWITKLQLTTDTAALNIALLVALAFPDRIARLRSKGNLNYQLSSGSGVELQADSSLQQSPWLAVAEIGGQRQFIRLACQLSKNDLELLAQHHSYLVNEQVVIDWLENGQLIAESKKRIGKLIWQKQPLPKLNQEQWDQAWIDYFQRHKLNALPWNDQCHNLQQRLMLAYQCQPEADWPESSDQNLLDGINEWLLPFLSSARHQRDLKKVELYNALLSRLNWEQQQTLDQLLPTHIQVASGSRIRIDYSQSPPVLAVKLQEMLGFQGQPAVMNGQIPLMIHLLSPAQRPLAVTQDLQSFWQNAYPDVRKDMRGRYPKHPWPENPLAAAATRYTKRKG